MSGSTGIAFHGVKRVAVRQVKNANGHYWTVIDVTDDQEQIIAELTFFSSCAAPVELELEPS